NLSKLRMHDLIVGVLYLVSVLLALFVNLNWIYLAAGVAVLQIISPLTKFCPVYALLNKMMPESDPIQNGR
ncbi:MAG: DUF2892 domain-containing protein, partial [Flavobacteriaceae bacterium]|nr:DUF2892 domain-containing protein [Flavobacteriaceae bacterium]